MKLSPPPFFVINHDYLAGRKLRLHNVNVTQIIKIMNMILVFFFKDLSVTLFHEIYLALAKLAFRL